MSNEFINFVVYPSLVIMIGGVGALITSSVVKYFNKLNLTLMELNKSIQMIILDQTKMHGEQAREMSILNEEVKTEKTIRHEHRKEIDKLFDITDRHEILIAKII